MASSEAAAQIELGELFHAAVTEHPDVMAECLSILRIYGLTPSALFYKYEAFLMSRPSGLRAKLSVLTLDTIRELRKEIQREHQTKALSTPSDTPKAATVGMKKGKGGMSDLGGFLDGLSTPSRPSKSRPTAPMPSRLANGQSPATSFLSSPASAAFSTPQKPSPMSASTSSYRPTSNLVPPSEGASLQTPTSKTNGYQPSSPVSGNESSAVLTSQPPPPFKLRAQPHSLVETLNPHLSASTSSSSKPRVSLSAHSDVKSWAYRYMFEKISQRSASLDDLIDEFANTIKDSYGVTELGDPHFVSEDSIYTVGRILSPPTDNRRAVATNLYLESSRLIGNGRRVAINFAPPGQLKVRGGTPGVKGFGVFPGCLVCVKGRNGGGGVFVVEEVLIPPPNPLAQSPADELLDFQHGDRLNGQPLSMIVAAGPYTLEDDLNYEPFNALVDVVISETPDVLILLGPFVDSQHPMILVGNVTQTPSEIFRDKISSRLQQILDQSPGTVIILVPNVRDMVSRHVAFPQAMLEKEALGLSKKIKVLPNPCTFSINEILISLSSVDVLFHLRRAESFQRAEEAEPDLDLKGSEVVDVIAGSVRHVLNQRNFYPIFPPPEQHSAEVNLDVTHYPLLKMEGPAPDILILPSKLRHFSKIVDSTLVINPAFTSRAHSAGTFAKLIVHPTPREILQGGGMDVDDVMREHGIWERARSEIWRV
ncbi:DNA polymerase alpha subunit B, partial [Tremellales sp. Uapishka_1]